MLALMAQVSSGWMRNRDRILDKDTNMMDNGSIDAFIMDTGSIDGFWIDREWIKKTTKAALGPNAAGAAFVVFLIHPLSIQISSIDPVSIMNTSIDPLSVMYPYPLSCLDYASI